MGLLAGIGQRFVRFCDRFGHHFYCLTRTVKTSVNHYLRGLLQAETKNMERMESLDYPEGRAAGLLALRTVAEAYGGLSAVAAEAGVTRQSLSRALSPKGNPTLNTLLAVLKTVGLRLSVEPERYTPT